LPCCLLVLREFRDRKSPASERGRVGMPSSMNNRRHADAVLESESAVLHQSPHVWPVAKEHAAPVLKKHPRVFFGVRGDGRRRDRADGALKKPQRGQCLGPVQKDFAGLRVDPVSAVTPEAFEIRGDESLVLFALPKKSPAVRCLEATGQPFELIEGCGWV